jgi:hypothetical protein
VGPHGVRLDALEPDESKSHTHEAQFEHEIPEAVLESVRAALIQEPPIWVAYVDGPMAHMLDAGMATAGGCDLSTGASHYPIIALSAPVADCAVG